MLKKLWEKARDAVANTECVGCGQVTQSNNRLCPACWRDLVFVTRPFCASCGQALSFSDMACCSAVGEHISYHGIRSALLYRTIIRKLILAFKYHNQLHLRRLLGSMMHVGVGRDLKETCDILIPVPLHRRKLRERGYNQAWELTKDLAARLNMVGYSSVLLRHKHTVAQAGLKLAERENNVEKAFSIPPKKARYIKGKRVALIDDIVTTGATANACSEVLLAAGATTVTVFSLARANLSDINVDGLDQV